MQCPSGTKAQNKAHKILFYGTNIAYLFYQYCLFILPILLIYFSNIGKIASKRIMANRPLLPIDHYWKTLVAGLLAGLAGWLAGLLAGWLAC
jgi:hypothetical protein